MKILVISLAGIGDTLLVTPLIHELRANFPEATIDGFVLWPGARNLIENNPHLNRLYHKDLIKSGKLDALNFLLSLRKNRYDVSINTHPQSRMHYRIAARIIGAPVRISHEYECFHWLDRHLVNQILQQDYTRHSVENNFDILPLIGGKVKLPSHQIEIFLTPEEEKFADEFFAKNQLSGKKVLGIHVGSGGTKNLPLKRWPVKNYAGLVRRLNNERPDIRVLLFGGADEAKDHQVVMAQSNPDLTLEAKTQSFRQTAALIKRCSAFLSVDTALMHVAAAMKTPNQIVIEAMTLNATNLPYGNDYTLVKNPAIGGRHLEYYRYDGGDIKGTREELLRIMSSVKIEDVFDAVTKALTK
ncbi:MAG TPA: glycosyltransferase family 9 protein [Candidatus Acidoferrales bacterium]|jgi:heptosyltransferase-2|nr:glycosyltransferase family 9 protein [Candidatus Acidoferrales bacterium]